ncbi:AGE family epimerase/isomerase [Parapedobacter lycopersici]|uniref:AGE family epimerase/isomerase n=1 Tax=Parapedobacter lycopersici TaxID=1864939 RepID=UPI00214D8E30|nr:AGE family epimerase/isomerase [Parapedobacter lycopersici]
MSKDYSRRAFIRQQAFAGLGVMGLGALGCTSGGDNRRDTGVGHAAAPTIADMELPARRERYHTALFDGFLPNMDQYVIDHELGGFMCNVNIATRKLETTDKRAWFEGRGMWTYAFLYNHFEQNPAYLEVVRKSRDFILPRLPADGRFYPTSFSKEGEPRSTGEGDIYGNLFVAEGLAEYAKASGEREYFEQAKEIVLKAADRYDRDDYTYAYKSDNPLPGPRILGHWMILISVSTQLLKQEADPQIQALADRCATAILTHHINGEHGLVNEAIGHDLKPLADPVALQYADLGHGCESFAFVMAYAVFRKDAALFDRAATLFKHHVEVATDPVYGGHFTALPNTDEYQWTLTKARWVQEEILIGALHLIEHRADPWAIRRFLETDAYIQEKFVRPEYAFVIDSGDRKLEKHSQVRAENYHRPRQLMVSMLAFDRIKANGYKPSGLFDA